MWTSESYPIFSGNKGHHAYCNVQGNILCKQLPGEWIWLCHFNMKKKYWRYPQNITDTFRRRDWEFDWATSRTCRKNLGNVGSCPKLCITYCSNESPNCHRAVGPPELFTKVVYGVAWTTNGLPCTIVSDISILILIVSDLPFWRTHYDATTIPSWLSGKFVLLTVKELTAPALPEVKGTSPSRILKLYAWGLPPVATWLITHWRFATSFPRIGSAQETIL